MKNKVIYLIICFLIAGHIIYAEDKNNIKKLIEELNRKFENVQTFVADTKFINKKQEDNPHLTIGKTYYKKPYMWRGELSSPEHADSGFQGITVKNKEYKLTYIPFFNIAYKYNIKKQNEILKQIHQFSTVIDLPNTQMINYVTSYEEDQREICVFEILSDNNIKNDGAEKIILEFHRSNGLAKALRMYINDKEVSILQFSNFKINIPIDDSLFYIDLPENVKIIDMTKKVFKEVTPEY